MIFFISGFVLSLIGVVVDSAHALGSIGMSWFMAGTACVVSTIYFYTVGLLFHRIFVIRNITGWIPSVVLAAFLSIFAVMSSMYYAYLDTSNTTKIADMVFSVAGAIIGGYTIMSCLVIRYFTLKELKK